MFFFKDKKRIKVGLALGSGGFRGSAHIAVIKALVKNNIPIDFIAGSSVGAVIGAHYALFKDVEKLEKDFFELQKHKVHHLRDVNFRYGLLGGHTLERELFKIFAGARLEDLAIPFRAVATDLVSGEEHIFSKGDLAQAVRASSSVPFTFKPFKLGDKILVDGALSNAVPDDIVKKMGADVVISVNLYNKYNIVNRDLNLAKIITRSAEIALYNLSQDSMKSSDFIINPDTSKYSDLSRLKAYFKKEVSLDIIKITEKEVGKIIPKIKKML
ncbi:MAG: patatin-like phospholipase family protein [Patescibacteria group bacterium]|jgi:NTE family protein